MNRIRHTPVGTMSTHRVEALSDGVFAIVMTLLVFDIRLPEGVDAAQLPMTLLNMWPSFLGYAISFVLLGIYWIGHRNQFNFIQAADQNLHWLNMLFFGLSALVPFSTGLISRYPGQWFALAVYGGNLIAIGIALYLHWAYATRDFHLVDEDISPRIVRVGTERCLLAPAGYLVAILAGLASPAVSLLLFALVPLLYIFPGIQHMWGRLTRR